MLCTEAILYLLSTVASYSTAFRPLHANRLQLYAAKIDNR